jgi:hypothetical protein
VSIASHIAAAATKLVWGPSSQNNFSITITVPSVCHGSLSLVNLVPPAALWWHPGLPLDADSLVEPTRQLHLDDPSTQLPLCPPAERQGSWLVIKSISVILSVGP